MIIGIGTDLVEVERIRRIIGKWGERFLKRVFTAGEIAYCERRRIPSVHYAARFAAKESCLKSLGAGFGMGVSPTEIEVKRSAEGSPMLQLHGRAQRIFDEKGGAVAHISLSHTREIAAAVVVIEA